MIGEGDGNANGNGNGADGDGARRLHLEICERLNVEAASADAAWAEYQETFQNFTLEGDQAVWLGCALYSACRRTATPTVNDAGGYIQGNFVSLTQLLLISNIKIADFFVKMKRWIEMTSAPESFQKAVTQLERNFSISAILYKKFAPIFTYIFGPLDTNAPTKPAHKSSKKNKITVCTTNTLYEMCWYLFICVKGEFPRLSDQLVHMYHMLLSCMDTVFQNAYITKRDLISPSFEGLPAKNAKCKDAPCIIGLLSKKFEGSIIEAKTVKQYSWKPTLRQFFEKGFLMGDSESLTGLIDPDNFDSNLKSINDVYGTYILSVGEFDERKFIGNFLDIDYGACEEVARTLGSLTSQNLQNGIPDTPLTGRKYLNKKSELLTPVSLATHSVAKLHAYLSGCSNSPSPRLIDIFEKCQVNPLDFVINHQKMLAVKFLTTYAPLSTEEIAGNRLNIAEVLYYRLLESVLHQEQQKKKGRVDLQRFFTNETFLKSLFVCSMEIVLHSYSHQTVRFPWILSCLSMEAFYFYKIIEIVVLVIKDKLSRDTIKHLSSIEEQVLESASWTSSSPVWQAIKDANNVVPAWIEVRIDETANARNLQPSLESASASERFLSPKSESTRKQLFKDSIKPGKSLLSPNVSTNGIPQENILSSKLKEDVVLNENVTPPRRIGSLGLFFRKFYCLAWERLKFLCNALMLEQPELKQKIWTCYEYTIINQTHLMKDRHLDQILMCTVYVICKVSSDAANEYDRTFSNIMRAYRLQPRADSNVYRSVLANLTPNDESEKKETRVDLIEFYNTIYIQNVTQFVMASRDENCPLSPVPTPHASVSNRNLTISHRISDQISVHVHPLTENMPDLSNHKTLKYCFNRSSSKDLQLINSLMSKENFVNRKRPSLNEEINSFKKICSDRYVADDDT